MISDSAVEPFMTRLTRVTCGNFSGIENDLSGRGLTLYQGEEGPCMVTIVNSSRIISDINRDLGRVLGQS